MNDIAKLAFEAISQMSVANKQLAAQNKQILAQNEQLSKAVSEGFMAVWSTVNDLNNLLTALFQQPAQDDDFNLDEPIATVAERISEHGELD